jgi:integral membrane protein (TIGR00529 family)
MYALLSMFIALALLVVLLHFKVRIGRAMMIAAFALAALLRVTPGSFWNAIVTEWKENALNETTGYLFVSLTALVMLVNVIGIAMQETGVAQRLSPALHGLFRSRRLAMSAIPMMMGLLPTPGGIMLSAPMVRELGDHIGVERARQAAINYFFRHQWETVWPLFPSIPLIQVMFNISAFALISHNLAISITGIISGVVFLLLFGIPPKSKEKISHAQFHHNLINFAHAFWPIGLVAILFAVTNLPPAAGLLIAIPIFLLCHKVSLKRWPVLFKSGFTLDFAFLIFGALLFKVNLEAGNAITQVVNFLSEFNVPPKVVMFFLPFIVAFLTGLTLPSVVITFPFFIPYIGNGPNALVGLETLAFSGLVCGLLMTPVHLCLALSASYFETHLLKIILRILGPVFFIALAGILMARFCV